MNIVNVDNIYGGAFKLTTTFFNSVSRYVKTVMEVGQSLGSSIRRIIKRNYC